MTFSPLDIALFLAALAAFGFGLWRMQSSHPDLVRLTSERNARAEEAGALRLERDALQKRVAAAEQREAGLRAEMAERAKSFERESAQFAKLQAEGEARFRSLAAEALVKSQ